MQPIKQKDLMNLILSAILASLLTLYPFWVEKVISPTSVKGHIISDQNKEIKSLVLNLVQGNHHKVDEDLLQRMVKESNGYGVTDGKNKLYLGEGIDTGLELITNQSQ